MLRKSSRDEIGHMTDVAERNIKRIIKKQQATTSNGIVIGLSLSVFEAKSYFGFCAFTV